MAQLIISFLAGVLTVLAPCILPLLPVILAGSVTETSNKRRPFVIIASLSVSVFLFTLLLKGSTALISVPPSFWSYVSATILAIFGLTLLFPETWAKVVLKIPGHNKADRIVSKGYGDSHSLWTDIAVGAALGPVFTTCSPTFFVILATVLPQSLSLGLLNLAAYIVGLALILLLIALIGQKFVDRLEWATNPYGWFKKTLGALFLVLGVLIASGLDKKIETAILDAGFFDVTKLEQSIRESLEDVKDKDIQGSDSTTNSGENNSAATTTPSSSVVLSGTSVAKVYGKLALERNQGKYTEFTGIAGYINTEPLKLADFVGKKVILIDFIDYTCINCQRTFPYLNDWYAKYKDQGLEIVAIHTPEFAFEKEIENVRKGIDKFGLKFPIVLDNDYATWNAYSNRYWPHKFIIDIRGNVVYDHIGEGAYAETEEVIVDLLNQRKQILNPSTDPADFKPIVAGWSMPEQKIQTQSPETYFGASRNELFGNGRQGSAYADVFRVPSSLEANTFYLDGKWKIDKEYAENEGASAQVSYVFKASNMYIVAQTADGSMVEAQVLLDGKPISSDKAGADVSNGKLIIDSSRLYHLFKSSTAEAHRIDIIFSKPKVRIFTFTFG